MMWQVPDFINLFVLLVTSSAHPFRWYSPITAVYSSRLTGSLRMLLSTACNLCSANGRLSGNRISPGSTIALLSTANRRMLACDETDHLPNPESFFLLGAGCRWIRAPRTSSTTVPCCLQFERSDTGIERLTLDSPDQKQLILELFQQRPDQLDCLVEFFHQEISRTNRRRLTRGQGASRLVPLDSANDGGASNLRTGQEPTGYHHRSVRASRLQWVPRRDRVRSPLVGLV
ncbi:hypothetical protein T02_7796 [Trichinella nativa]|uniref:Uncharacterized protein n=1 Tax=Trichinella nativa TaxID=6335 RepID=A0A0V1LQE5_9BILA|nr:hypothetical protein T02_7796 [Trichinella nativa]